MEICHRTMIVPLVMALCTAAGAVPEPARSDGRTLYAGKGCYACHGYAGQGSLLTGPRIAPDPAPIEAFTAVIRRPPGEMPAYSPASVTDAELAAIHAYLSAIPPPPPAIPEAFPDR
jgi:ubiquinol-cytochrome c reductase cytochrome c subunit